MIFNKNGDMFVYEDKMFIIGEEVFASESAYAGLLGRIKEIRTGDDRKIENEGTDIYCAFREPILRLDAELLSKLRISNEDASIDEIIMAPEMLIPTREVGAGGSKMKVYAVIEDCVVDAVDKSETKLFADKQHAEIVMRRSIEEEREDGCIRDWRSSELLVEEQYDDLYFTAYFKNEYCFNHYTVYVKEMELALSVPFAKETLSAICEANHQLSHQSKLPN